MLFCIRWLGKASQVILLGVTEGTIRSLEREVVQADRRASGKVLRLEGAWSEMNTGESSERCRELEGAASRAQIT